MEAVLRDASRAEYRTHPCTYPSAGPVVCRQGLAEAVHALERVCQSLGDDPDGAAHEAVVDGDVREVGHHLHHTPIWPRGKQVDLVRAMGRDDELPGSTKHGQLMAGGGGHIRVGVAQPPRLQRPNHLIQVAQPPGGLRVAVVDQHVLWREWRAWRERDMSMQQTTTMPCSDPAHRHGLRLHLAHALHGCSERVVLASRERPRIIGVQAGNNSGGARTVPWRRVRQADLDAVA